MTALFLTVSEQKAKAFSRPFDPRHFRSEYEPAQRRANKELKWKRVIEFVRATLFRGLTLARYRGGYLLDPAVKIIHPFASKRWDIRDMFEGTQVTGSASVGACTYYRVRRCVRRGMKDSPYEG